MLARHRKKKNFIAKLKEGDNILTTHEEKDATIFDFYSNLIGKESDRNRTINLDTLDIPLYDLEALDVPFSQEEVWNTVKTYHQIMLRALMDSPKSSTRPVGW